MNEKEFLRSDCKIFEGVEKMIPTTQKEIRETVDRANHPYNFDKATRDLFDEDGKTVAMHIYQDEDVKLITNAPTWLLHQQEIIEQLQKENERLRNSIQSHADCYYDRNGIYREG